MEELNIVLSDEGDTLSCPSSAGRPSHAMNVVLRVGGDIVVENAIDSGNVESTRSDICGNEDAPASALELVEGAETGGLGELAVEGDGGEGEETEEDGKTLRVENGADEDDDGVAGEGVCQVDEVKILVLHGDEEVVLEKSRDGLVPVVENRT